MLQKIKRERELLRTQKYYINGVLQKQVRKSSHKGVLRSREWLNTQELLSRKHISVTGELFKFYIKDIIRLYCYKFLYSREYLNENAYKNDIREIFTPEKLMFRYCNLKLHG